MVLRVPDTKSSSSGNDVETNTPNTTHRQVMTIGDDTAATKATVGATGLEVDVQASALPTGASTSAGQLADGHNVTVDNAAGASAVNIQDGGNTISVDAASLPLPTGAATAAAQLADGHNVTVDNAAAGAAVNIQDGGNSITVDNATISVVGGGTEATAQRVTIANDSTGVVTVDAASLPLPTGAATNAAQLADGHNVTVDNGAAGAAVNVQDGGNSLTVDNSTLAVVGGGTEAAAMRVTIANNSTGVVTVDAAALPLPSGAATSAAQLADGHNVTIDNAAGASAVNIQDGGNAITVDGTVTANAGSGTLLVDLAGNNDVTATGNVAHDAADSGSPVKIGHQAAIFSAAPPTVSADSDRVNSIATVEGIQFTLGGHPDIITREWMTTGAQTNDPIIDAVTAPDKIVITAIEVLNDVGSTGDPQVRIGFGAASVPAEPTTGNSVVGVVLSHPGIAAGSGVIRGSGSGVLAVGAAGEELRITCASPTGQLTVIVTYWLTQL